ncbi:hypothetical protein DRQ27_02170 [bacterium]|nr:MAG: hypothetical protein DRQ27_02170 [bacterium]
MKEPDSQNEEAQLVHKAKQGDKEAFDALMLMTQDYVFRLAYRMLDNKDDALDVMQEAFYRAYRSLKSFRGDSSFRYWVETIATRLCIARYRKKRIFVRIEEIVGLGKEPEQDNLDSEKESRILQDALGTLTPRERAALVLQMEGGKSIKEIANTMGVAEGTVKALIHRAKEKLYKKLRKYFKR